MAGEPTDRDVALDATRSPSELDATVASSDAPATGGPRDLPVIANDRYKIGNEIGRGGIGRVLEARDEVLERPVALKQLLATDDGSRARFLREALITARLQHPSIVPIYEAGRRADGSPFYAMRLVAGEPLEGKLAAARTLEQRLALIPTVLAVADAIAYAHSERIIHRDLKPGNVLVGKFGETVVIDWGLAKNLAIDDRGALPIGPFRSSADQAQTVVGSVMGTPGYMAPEQAAGDDADERADVYALGAILYHVVAGTLPHQGTTLEDVIAKVIRGDIRPLRAIEPNAPPDLAAIVGKAMAVDKAERYRDANGLADDLRKFQTGQLVGAHRYTTGDRVRRWIRRHRAISAVSAIALIVIAVGAIVSVRGIIAERRTADEQRLIANEQRDQAVNNLNRSIINQARSLRNEPARLLKLLGTLDPAGPGWDAARMLAGEALSQPRLIAQTRGPQAAVGKFIGMAAFELTRDGRRGVAYDQNGIWVMDLVAMRTTLIRHGNDPSERRLLEICDDGLRAYTLTGGFGSESLHEVDLVAGTVKARKAVTGRDFAAAVEHCHAGRALTAGPEGLVWRNPATGQTVTLSTVPMAAAWLAPDRIHVVALDREGWLRRFDLAGKELGAIPGPDGPASPPQYDLVTHWPTARAALSHDGSTVVTETQQPPMYWNFTHGRTSLDTGEKSPSYVVTPDGGVAYLTTEKESVEVVARPRPEFTIAEIPSGKLAISPDGAWLVGLDNDQVTILDRATRVPRLLRGHANVEHIAFRPDGSLVTVGEDSIRAWDLGKPGRSHGRAGAHAAAFSPDGRWLALDNAGSIARWDVERGQVETTVERDRSVFGPSIAVTDQGEVLFTVEGSVYRWPRGGAMAKLGDHPNATSASAAFLPGGTPITASHDRVVIWQTGGPRTIALPRERAARVPHGFAIEVDRDGKRILVECRPQGETQRTCVIDLEPGTVSVLPATGGMAAIAPNGRIAITGIEGEAYAIWDLDRRTIIKQSTTVGAVTELGISRDGTRAIVGGLGGLDTIDLATFEIAPVASAERGNGGRLQWAPDGKTVVGADLMLRDVASGELRRVGPAPHVAAVSLSNTKLTLVTWHGVIQVADDLPRDPVQLRALLTELPYALDNHNTLVVLPR